MNNQSDDLRGYFYEIDPKTKDPVELLRLEARKARYTENRIFPHGPRGEK